MASLTLGETRRINASTTERVLLQVKNCTLNGQALTNSSYLMRVTNRGYAVSIEIDIEGLELNVSSLGSILTTNNQSGTALSNGIAS